MKKGTGRRAKKGAEAKGRRNSSTVQDGGPSRGVRDPDELLPEYDAELIRAGVRGKYADRYAAGTNVVVLEPDVAAAFPDAAAVNSALRALLEIARRQTGGRAPAA
jgi:hypothetical protein